MKAYLLLLLAFGMISGLRAQAPTSEERRFVEAKKDEAEASLTLRCSLDGIFQNQERAFYFRTSRGIGELGLVTSTSTNTDGLDGTGYGFSTRADAASAAVKLEIFTYWTTRTASGKSDLTLQVPYFQDKKGQDAGFSYSLVWKRLKSK